MKLRISITPAADRDLDDLFGYIAQDNRDAAIRFLEAIHEAFERLSEMPQIGVVQSFDDPRLEGLRMWPIRGFEKHLIFYKPRTERIEIIRILHASRDIEGLFDM